jgi:hypothetical protein
MNWRKSYGVENIAADLLQAVDVEKKHTLYSLVNNILDLWRVTGQEELGKENLDGSITH